MNSEGNSEATGERWAGLRLYRFGAVDSTNSVVWRYRDAGIVEELAVVATQQTAGRGQWGRVWQSAPGGLFLSVGLGDRADGAYPLAIAWGIASVLQQQGLPVRLKWPNDLILNGKKVGGLLVESRSSDPEFVVVGLGLNWVNPVPESATRLGDYPSAIPDLEQLTALAWQGIQAGRSRWQHDRENVLRDWWENLAWRTVTEGGRQGQAVGIGPHGELQVQWADRDRPEAYSPGTLRVGYNAAR